MAGQIRLLLLHTHYLLSKQYYAEVLCINKTKAELQCEGRCALKKEMEQERKTDIQHPPRFELTLEYLTAETISILTANLFSIAGTMTSAGKHPKAFDHYRFVFQPPELFLIAA